MRHFAPRTPDCSSSQPQPLPDVYPLRNRLGLIKHDCARILALVSQLNLQLTNFDCTRARDDCDEDVVCLAAVFKALRRAIWTY
jgi:hypothetical protein